jgi:hypothetical protein
MQKLKTLCADALSYLPPISFFARAALADAYFVADDIQFSTNGFCHRAKIKTSDGVRMLSLPVLTKGRGAQHINQVEIDGSRHWQRRHWRSIGVNYCHAAYFEQFADEIQALFQKQYKFLHEVNLAFLRALWRWLEMPSTLRLTSEFPALLKREKRLIELAQKTGASIYLCDEGYRKVLSPEIFAEAGLRVCFADFSGADYFQPFGNFQPGLSMLDLLLNEGSRAAREYIEIIAKRVRSQIAAAAS